MHSDHERHDPDAPAPAADEHAAPGAEHVSGMDTDAPEEEPLHSDYDAPLAEDGEVAKDEPVLDESDEPHYDAGAPDEAELSAGAEGSDAQELDPQALGRRDKGALLTALLFTATETLDADKAAEYLGLSPADLAVLVEEQSGELRNLGLDILPLAGGYKLVTASHWDGFLALFHRQIRKARLSKSALEILAVIAYEQPISRVRVDELRQANSEAAVRTLLDRRLIKVAGRAETPGRPFLYKTTETFLEVFGLTSLDDLPPRPASFKAEAEEAEEKLQSEEGTGDLHVRGESDE